jgi:ATP-dependent RNA helicase DeaD
MSEPSTPDFSELGLPDQILKAVTQLGYETPSPIQAQAIPSLLEGRDIIGQAQTGTGKTAAFALPLLSRVDTQLKAPQILVLTPTRELAIQVAEAFQAYAANLKGFHVLPIYGGQAYNIQLRQLKRGAQVVVGTPGRIMDHLERKTLKLDSLQAMVLDEADEMLRMGFIEDVEWILARTPEQKQVALFSATMPPQIQKVAQRYLHNPEQIRIKAKTQTAKTIRQLALQVNGRAKMDALTRILEVTEFDAILIFVRTKSATVELAEKLEARGYASEALNGDIAQKMRERTVERLKQGRIDIVVATDVAARGLDVERISHVINYDIPYDAESYVHRIGRTGRAGRSGEAILFVTARERRLLRTIENTTQQKIENLTLPSTTDINQQRMLRFKQRIQQTIDSQSLDSCRDLVASFIDENDSDPLTVSAALVKMVQGDEPLLLADVPPRAREGSKRERGSKMDSSGDKKTREIDYDPRPLREFPEIPMRRYRLDVGRIHGVQPGNIVGAIANEAELESSYIGRVDIYDDFTLIDLPDGMPGEVYRSLKKARAGGRPLAIEAVKQGKPKVKKSRAKPGEDSKHPPRKRKQKPDHKTRSKRKARKK